MAGTEKAYHVGTDMNCGGACLLKAYVKDGIVVRMETDDGDEPQLRNCLRCRAYRQRIYAPDRVLHRNEHPFGVRSKVHGPADAAYPALWDHPVRQVAVS